MEMEDTRKRPSLQTGGGCPAKKPRDAEPYGEEKAEAYGDGDEDEIAAWVCEDEYYTVGELMKLLGTEEASAEMKVKFIENPHAWTMMEIQSSSSYVTINGNEESCGPSFSDSESSVMASVDTVGVKLDGVEEGWLEKWTGGAWGASEECASGRCDGDWEEDMLTRFLGEEDGHTHGFRAE